MNIEKIRFENQQALKAEIETEGDVDDRAILDKKVSVTPLHYDLTNYSYLEELKSWNIER